ncbi:MAG TPA: DNA (cytosine-5-)-methyltransferase [Pirellulaceae bacterium]|nr:DNA (cytosine-5-)-methyltransferase [Pirellulaceae bacterium]HMO93929.1 DNA (cytosine-5-)-methyltransferase [Pirellulaceae bacterium]HMP69760.1 DNA (cytosine-5-)-methyltransferase [Pirellulaceae bacterium]
MPIASLKFADLFAGLGGFHLALQKLGHRCVFACEIDDDLARLYQSNFSIKPCGDLRQIVENRIPKHDVLCAGFPCQPFSKAGEQKGTNCRIWGDLFSGHVLRVIRHHHPKFLLMENVANLERHDAGRTWLKMKKQLEAEGYFVKTAVLSPHKLGVPQIRERLYIVASLDGLDGFRWPQTTELDCDITSVLDVNPSDAKPLSPQVMSCLETWQRFLRAAPKSIHLPSFPIWTMEFGATYPFTKYNSLRDISVKSLRNYKGSFGQSLNCLEREDVLARLPSYARGSGLVFPKWKQDFIRQNREFFESNKRWIKPLLAEIRGYPSSLQKFEWNCQGEERNIWKYVIQFRASGVRVKRPTTAPSLVAMTTTQVPIIAWEKRYMTQRECSRLQCMGEIELPSIPSKAYKALGNAVNAEVVRQIAYSLIGSTKMRSRRIVA